MKSLKLFIALLGGQALGAFTDGTYRQCIRAEPQHVLSNQSPLCLHHNEQPITSQSTSLEHAPWSIKPYCVSKAEWDYCTHTAANVRNGHGLSIISIPTAANAISLAFPRVQEAQQVPEDNLEVRTIPGKGFGLITLRPVGRGQIILVDSPRIVASSKFPAHVLHAEGASLFQQAVSRLPSQDRDAVLSLDKSLGGTDIEDIMKTNAFACQLNDGSEGDAYMCLFPSVARINHACRPNAHARFVPKTLLMEIKALRDIAAGEEISISYGRVDLKHAERQKLYKDGWNFTCTCDMCTSSKYDVAGSDQRRARFAQLRKKLENLTQDTYDAQQIVAWEKESMDLSAKEGLDVLLAADYERLAYVYAGHGMVNEAKHWANRAKESLMGWTVVDGGPNNELRRIQDLLAELGI